MISILSIGPRTLWNDCNHSATAIFWRSAISSVYYPDKKDQMIRLTGSFDPVAEIAHWSLPCWKINQKRAYKLTRRRFPGECMGGMAKRKIHIVGDTARCPLAAPPLPRPPYRRRAQPPHPRRHPPTPTASAHTNKRPPPTRQIPVS